MKTTRFAAAVAAAVVAATAIAMAQDKKAAAAADPKKHVMVAAADMEWKDGPPSLPAGGFSAMLPKTHHFAWTREETVVQVHGMGPWGINYVNPDDDPRKKK